MDATLQENTSLQQPIIWMTQGRQDRTINVDSQMWKERRAAVLREKSCNLQPRDEWGDKSLYLGPDLVPALSRLNVNYFSHGSLLCCCWSSTLLLCCWMPVCVCSTGAHCRPVSSLPCPRPEGGGRGGLDGSVSKKWQWKKLFYLQLSKLNAAQISK